MSFSGFAIGKRFTCLLKAGGVRRSNMNYRNTQLFQSLQPFRLVFFIEHFSGIRPTVCES